MFSYNAGNPRSGVVRSARRSSSTAALEDEGAGEVAVAAPVAPAAPISAASSPSGRGATSFTAFVTRWSGAFADVTQSAPSDGSALGQWQVVAVACSLAGSNG